MVDRIISLLRRERQRAVFPLVCADHCAWLAKTGFEDAATDPQILAAVTEQAHHRYNYDLVLLFSDAYVEAQALGCPVKLNPFPTLTGPRTDHKIDRTNVIIEAVKILKSNLKVPIFVSIKGVFSLASFLAGIKEFMVMLLKNPVSAREFLHQAMEFQLSYIDRLLELGIHIMIGDPVASASLISPQVFADFAYQPLQTMVTMIKNQGSISAIHICGDTVPIIDQLDSIGTDILSIENISVSTKTLKMGGVSTATIRYGTASEISQEINATYSEPFLLLSTACDVPVETPPENIIHMVQYANAQDND